MSMWKESRKVLAFTVAGDNHTLDNMIVNINDSLYEIGFLFSLIVIFLRMLTDVRSSFFSYLNMF